MVTATELSTDIAPALLWRDNDRVLRKGWLDDTARGRIAIVAVTPVTRHSQALRRLINEYELRDILDGAWSLPPVALAKDQHTLFLEDRGGVPLASLTGEPMDIAVFMRVAIGLTNAIARLHDQGVIHKDIRPSNTFVNTATNEVWLTGFGIAAPVPRQRQSPAPPEVIQGTLAYMAPEQTGCTNRSIDARADLYSLGVTLYELLTGTLPFNASEPMEWIHCHIARQPMPPSDVTKDIPAALSALVMKLLAKDAEERYQTAAGLHHDLLHCLNQWERHRHIAPFALGTTDHPDQLSFQEKLYGRQAEVHQLIEAFRRAAMEGGCELVLISGYSGIGKSAVVRELHKDLASNHGLFASGKFDQYQRGIPYAPLAEAFRALVRQMLSKSDTELERWRFALNEALGIDGQLVINVVPELALIIGDQPSVPELSGREAQNRFLHVFRRFVGVFARQEHPLVLFLDDLQWLDAATLDVFEHLAMSSESKHLLLVGAYRDNEVGPTHPLTTRLEMIQRSARSVHEIVLSGIHSNDVGEMIADALGVRATEIRELAEIAYEKASGNPFFTIQFINATVDEGLITYDRRSGRVRFDLDRLRAKSVGDNIVELMIERLKRLDARSLWAVKQLACLGNSCDISTFRQVIGESAQRTALLLHGPLRAGLVFQLDETYAFSHDRVHEATYRLLSHDERGTAHRSLGSKLIAILDATDLESRLFEVASQFNRAQLRYEDWADRVTAASLNLRAGRKARASAAFGEACTYLSEGRLQLGSEGWTTHYGLSFELALEQAECTFLSGDVNTAQNMAAGLLERAATNVDLAAVHRLQIELHVAKSENKQAVTSGVAGLRLCGIDLPLHPTNDVVREEYDRVWRNLQQRRLESFAGLPPMADPKMRVVMRLLAELVPPAYFDDFNLTKLVICRMVNVSLAHGLTDASNQGLAMFGWIMGPVAGDYADGFRVADLARQLVVRRNVLLDVGRVTHLMGQTAIWTQPLTAAIEWFQLAHRINVQAGDFYFATQSSAHALVYLLLSGQRLDDVAGECQDHMDFAQRLGFPDGIDPLVALERTVAALRGLTQRLSDFNDENFDESVFEANLTGSRMTVVVHWYWTRKLMLHFLSGELEAALLAAEKVRKDSGMRVIEVQHLDYHYFSSLAIAARMDEVSEEEQGELRGRLNAHFDQLRTWAQQTQGPAFADKHLLIAAEIARLEGRVLDAERLYEESVHHARQNGFLQYQGVANQVAGRFYQRRGLHRVARMCFLEARECYSNWGAHAVVRHLDRTLPDIYREPAHSRSTSTPFDAVAQLDLATVLRVSQAVSGEIVPEKMMDTLMRTAIEHAGAQRAVLMLVRGSEHRVEAEAITAGDSVNVRVGFNHVVDSSLPQSIIHYVTRTRESVMLDDAQSETAFSDDVYVRQRQARSILCLPLTNEAKLVGLLYLENNLLTRVFTGSRLAILKILASQAAISLQNTYLYSDLEARESKIRRLIDSNIIGVFMWDLEGRILEANDALLRMVRFSREDLRSGLLSWKALSPEDAREADLKAIEMVKATRTVGPLEKEYLRKDGSRVPVLVGAAAFDAQPDHGVAFVIDLTEQKQAEQKFRESERRSRELQAELAHANRVATMGQLSAWVAHDVKQPLVGVVTSGNAALRWLSNEPPNIEAATRSVERVVRDGHRAAAVLDRTRGFVKKATPQRDSVDINAVIDETIALVAMEADRKKITLQTTLHASIPRVHVDRIQIQQVLLNLVVNAMQAMTTPAILERRLAITSELDSASRVVLVGVHDSGPGIDIERPDELFEAFYTTKADGLGMGLAICRTIVESHGGRIWAGPNSPRGAVFRFSLPIGGAVVGVQGESHNAVTSIDRRR